MSDTSHAEAGSNVPADGLYKVAPGLITLHQIVFGQDHPLWKPDKCKACALVGGHRHK